MMRNRMMTAAAVLMLVMLAGCRAQNTTRSDDIRDFDDAAFEAGANQPPNANTLYALAKILAAQGRDEEAEHLFTGILHRHPGYLPAYLDLAELHLRRNQTADAADILLDGLKVAGNDPVLLNNLGMVWLLEQEYERALDLFTEAAHIAPGNRIFGANRAAALGMLGRDEEAAAVYEQVLDSKRDLEHNMAVLRRARDAANGEDPPLPPQTSAPPSAMDSE